MSDLPRRNVTRSGTSCGDSAIIRRSRPRFGPLVPARVQHRGTHLAPLCKRRLPDSHPLANPRGLIVALARGFLCLIKQNQAYQRVYG